MRTPIREARELLQNSASIVVVTHVRPDGDAVASLLALLLSLMASGKNAVGVMLDKIPSRFQHLPGADLVRSFLPDEPYILIAVDCADPKRISLPEGELPETVDINIDHHHTNPHFGHVNFVQADAASTTQVLFGLLPEFGLPITTEVASNLMTGLVTDTIGFRTANMNSGVLRIAADLLDLGAPLPDIYEKSITQQTYETVRYWGKGLSRLDRQDSIVWTSLYLEDRTISGYQGDDDADLINLLSAIEGTEVSIVFVEQQNGSVKISLRSKESVNVAEVARKFGGGGHVVAAGAMLEGSMEDVVGRVIKATHDALLAKPERIR